MLKLRKVVWSAIHLVERMDLMRAAIGAILQTHLTLGAIVNQKVLVSNCGCNLLSYEWNLDLVTMNLVTQLQFSDLC